MKILRRVISVFCIVAMLCALVGCELSEEQKKQKAENERIAKPIIEEFCQKQFADAKYSINSIEGYHYTDSYGEFLSEYLSNLVKANITMSDENFNIYYDIKTKEFFSDINNNAIKNTFLKQFSSIISIAPDSCEFHIYPNSYENEGLSIVNVKDKEFDSLLSNSDYVWDIEITYNNEHSDFFNSVEASLSDFCSNIKGCIYMEIQNFNEFLDSKKLSDYDTLAINDYISIFSNSKQNDNLSYEYTHYSHYEIDGVFITCSGDTKLKVNKIQNPLNTVTSTYYSKYSFDKINEKAILIEPYNMTEDDSIYIHFDKGRCQKEYFAYISDVDTNKCIDLFETNVLYCRSSQRISIDPNKSFLVSFWKGYKQNE